MIRIIYTRHFLKSVRKLPTKIQDKLATRLELLQKNPFHPLLHTKPLPVNFLVFILLELLAIGELFFNFWNQKLLN